MFRQPGDKGKQEGIIMVHQHYGTQTVNRGAVLPGMLVKHKDSTWTASANARGRLYLPWRRTHLHQRFAGRGLFKRRWEWP